VAKKSQSYRKQILLFLLVFVLPCVVLALLSFRVIRQERELAGKRALDERRRITTEVSQYLFNRLETIKNQLVTMGSRLHWCRFPVVLLEDPDQSFLHHVWAPDGRIIYYLVMGANRESHSIVSHEIETGEEKTL